MSEFRFSEAVSLFVEWAQKNLAPSTLAGYRHYWCKFAEWAGDPRLEDITPAMVTTWRNTWHAIQAMQRLTSFSHKWARKIMTDPLAGLRRPPAGIRRRVFTPHETAKMLRGAAPELRAVLIALRESIARPGEIRLATWESIRRPGNLPFTRDSLVRGDCFIFCSAGNGIGRRTENDAVRMIPIVPRLGRLLLRRLDRIGEPNGLIFCDATGSPWTENGLRCAIRRLRVRLKIGGDWRGERIVAYTFRHTAATAAAAMGVRDTLLAAMMGHSTPRMTRRYCHLQADAVIEGARRIVEAQSRSREARRKRSR